MKETAIKGASINEERNNKTELTTKEGLITNNPILLHTKGNKSWFISTGKEYIFNHFNVQKKKKKKKMLGKKKYGSFHGDYSNKCLFEELEKFLYLVWFYLTTLDALFLPS